MQQQLNSTVCSIVFSIMAKKGAERANYDTALNFHIIKIVNISPFSSKLMFKSSNRSSENIIDSTKNSCLNGNSQVFLFWMIVPQLLLLLNLLKIFHLFSRIFLTEWKFNLCYSVCIDYCFYLKLVELCIQNI